MMYPLSLRSRAARLYNDAGKTMPQIASILRVSKATVWYWLNGRKPQGNPSQKTSPKDGEEYLASSKGQVETERKKVADLPDDPKLLKKLLVESHAERDVLRLANQILKERGGSSASTRTPSATRIITLSGRDKTRIVCTLRPYYRLTLLLRILHLDDSTYYYEKKALGKPDKHASLKEQVLSCPRECQGRWGYRRIRHQVLEKTDRTHLSEKLVRRIMRMLGIFPLSVAFHTPLQLAGGGDQPGPIQPW